MISTEGNEDAAWHRCEVAWSQWLQTKHFAVFHSGEAIGNSKGTRAPLMAIEGVLLRAPDLQTTKDGVSEYWEVKYRSRSDIDQLTGERIHWTSDEAFADYVAISDATGCKVWLVLYEGPTSTRAGRWLRADIKYLEAKGSEGTRYGRGGIPVPAWIWPVESMEIVEGPAVDLGSVNIDIVPNEGEAEHSEILDLESIERQLRLEPAAESSDAPFDSGASSTPPHLIEMEPILGLDILRRRLGIPAIPRYSVLRVGLRGLEVDDLLGVLHYGIRVFLISQEGPEALLDREELQAFAKSRLLEWAIIGENIDLQDQVWIIDGVFPEPVSDRLLKILDKADEVGGINIGQYKIVHSSPESDMLITAGAGTGKTETMSERLVFLLATYDGKTEDEADGTVRDVGLRVEDVVLMTFTRETAREMRERIAYTIMLRQRLCRRSVLPSLAWLMQLGGAEIATIHAFAKRILQSAGGALGWGPGLSVGRHTLALRSMMHDSLSPYLTAMIDAFADKVPPSYMWEDHFEKVWAALESNGVEMMKTAVDDTLSTDWGEAGGQGLERAVDHATRHIVEAVSAQYQELCLSNQAVRSADLVPLALASLRSEQEPNVRRPRYLFVDEFQDTDPLQMELILETKVRLGANLFVVGDGKQGIYRFRGAEGNAFKQLRDQTRDRGLTEFVEYPLSRNYRSGALLLNSIHPYFAKWNSSRHLVYAAEDRLRPVTWEEDVSGTIEFSKIKSNSYVLRAADDVAEWRRRDPDATIAILCRQNAQALAIKRQIDHAGGHCELLVGGDFYRSPTVRELVAFLRAVSEPNDDAALLQLCETRWAPGILYGHAPNGIEGPEWQPAVAPIMGWRERLGSVEPSGSYDRSDLTQLRQRLVSIGGLLGRMPLMAWVVECARAMAPEATHRVSDLDDSERNRYERCLDHVITLLDAQFESKPVSLQRLITWLELQVATNHSEDEPVDIAQFGGKTIALTVHKAKGLEFDRVLIPNTWTPFASHQKTGTKVTVLRRAAKRPRVIWEWSAGTELYSNVSASENHLWYTDSRETAREEARLLYVALTRAKKTLRVYVPSQGQPKDTPSSWADLLNYGR